MRPITLTLALTLALTGCITNQHLSESEEQPLHDSEAPIIIETDSLVPLELALPSGVLEIGHENAPLTLLVFTEHHCAYCAEFHKEQLPLLLTEYVHEGALRIQITPFILQKYEGSTQAAKAALCASTQGKGMQMHTLLFDSPNTFLERVHKTELNAESFASCLVSEETDSQIETLQAWAEELGVQYVPTFFLNGEKFVGLPYYADLRGRIEAVIGRLN
jgi:protein-disulfide isomerase